MKGVTEEERIAAIAAKIKALRIKAGFTSYEKFALHHGMDRKHYWRIEKGQNLTIKSLHQVLMAHEISLETFFQGLE